MVLPSSYKTDLTTVYRYAVMRTFAPHVGYVTPDIGRVTGRLMSWEDYHRW